MLKTALLAVALTISPLAMAAYPDKPVRIIVSNPAGGPVDVMLRVLGERLSAVWGQGVVVENKPGASGILSTQALLNSPADGYTLGMMVASALTILPFAVEKLPYDPQKDLQPVSLVARTPFVFVVPQASPIKNWQDFVRLSKTKDMTIGSLSRGTAFHLVWEQTAQRAGITALYAASTSSGKTQMDLMGGLLDIVLDAPSSAKGLIDSGRLRAIAITSPTRFSGLPNTPTLSESGLNGYASQPWIGLMAPAGVPPDVVAKIQRTIAQVLKEPEMVAKMELLGMVPVGSSSEELAAIITADRQTMEPLIKKLGITLK